LLERRDRSLFGQPLLRQEKGSANFAVDFWDRRGTGARNCEFRAKLGLASGVVGGNLVPARAPFCELMLSSLRSVLVTPAVNRYHARDF